MIIRCLVAATFAVMLQGALAQSSKRADLSIGLHRVEVEIADTQAAREQGLMNRKSLPEHAGMLFVFDVAKPYCFWMKNTFIPLTIAFIDDAGRIINLADMQPQAETNHCAAQPARYALEMNQGWFKARGIKPGERVRGIPAGTPARY